MLYEVRFTKEALKDFNRLSPKLQNKLKDILRHKIAVEPHSGKKLVGDLKGLYSVRLNYKDRIVYTIDEKLHVVTLLKTRTHYGE